MAFETQADPATEVTSFGTMPDGTAVDLYTVWAGDAVASFTSFGARLVSVMVPDRQGRLDDVVLGYDALALYLADKTFMGATVGRCANRLAGGSFTLDGVMYQVPLNNGPNALHGGPAGFDQQVWAAEVVEHGVEFTLVSPDGDQGFPGQLTVTVRYTFLGGVLRIEYTATCDKPTVVNLANHAYFNLLGERSQNVLGHQIRIPAEHYTPIDENAIPTGEIAPVAGTPFDLRGWTPIGRRIDEPDEQLARAAGYDHNWAFGQPGTLKLVAEVVESTFGRTLRAETTEPGMQFYTGNFLDGSLPDRNYGRYERRHGFCLETQHYPDSPNHPNFPTTTLRPGETFRSTTIYTFGVEA